MPQVGALIGAHPGTISLGQGIVSYGPSPGVEKRLASFFAVPANHEYGEVPGTPALIAALAEKLGGENGIDVDANGGDHTLVVTAGSNMAFLNSVLAVADPGDEIVLLRPFYFNHEMAIRIAGCTPVFVDTDARHQPNVSTIEAAITERTRAIVTVSPNNPTGAVYSRDVLLRINEMCGRRGLYHFSDEAYEYFLYGDAEHVSPGAFPGAADHTISFYTLSKSYDLTFSLVSIQPLVNRSSRHAERRRRFRHGLRPLPDSADHLSAYIRRRAGVTMQLHRALLLRSWSLLNNPIDLRSEPRCEQPT